MRQTLDLTHSPPPSPPPPPPSPSPPSASSGRFFFALFFFLSLYSPHARPLLSFISLYYLIKPTTSRWVGTRLHEPRIACGSARGNTLLNYLFGKILCKQETESVRHDACSTSQEYLKTGNTRKRSTFS